LISSNTLVASSLGAARTSSAIRAAHSSSITGGLGLVRLAGGPPFFSQLLMVLG
jgi:hypothetical protein